MRIHGCFRAPEGICEQKRLGNAVLDSLLADPFSFLEVDKDGFCFLCGSKLIYGTVSEVRVSFHMRCVVSIFNILHLDWVNLQLLMELQTWHEL